MGIILYIVVMAWIANLLSWRLEFAFWLWLKKNYLTMRLFNCSVCLSFWLTFLLTMILTGSFIFTFMIATVTSLLAALMESQLCKLN